jgi:hypothetical protein
MNFNNYNTTIPKYNNNHISNASISSVPKQMNSMPGSLMAPMISRVHKAKPGCSACGKKVA